MFDDLKYHVIKDGEIIVSSVFYQEAERYQELIGGSEIVTQSEEEYWNSL